MPYGFSWLPSWFRGGGGGGDGGSGGAAAQQCAAASTPRSREVLMQQLADAHAQLQRQKQLLTDQAEWQRGASAFCEQRAAQTRALQSHVRSLQADLRDEAAAAERVRAQLDVEARRSGALEAQLRAAEAQLAATRDGGLV
jgi:hypothetical protein